MDTRLTGYAIALFLVAYAGTTPLFSFFGAHINVALALAAVIAFSLRSPYEYALASLAGAAGLAAGLGVFMSLLFFGGFFIALYAVRHAVPWQPYLIGCGLVLIFSFVTYGSADFALMARLAPVFVREALYNVTAFSVLYLLMPISNARQGRRYQF